MKRTFTVMAMVMGLILSTMGMAAADNHSNGGEIETSPPLTFSSYGWGGWSCPDGKVALDGWVTDAEGNEPAESIEFEDIAEPGSEWPHHTFGEDEWGYVVQNGAIPQTLVINVECGEAVDPVDNRPLFVQECDDYEGLDYRNRGQCVRDHNPGRGSR